MALDPQSPDLPASPDLRHPSLGHASALTPAGMAAPASARMTVLPGAAEQGGEVA
ncbi:hypothetical protein AB0M36_14910 [Actinoplanes sp. NPDC051346]|uniref:hypothetical protein n=1 Tax=Actinoplanes sp. NPDC051346 TaxID=3155048 RepID=UPI00342A4246